MNSSADILQPKILLIMLLDILHHDLETGLVCTVRLFPEGAVLELPVLIQFIPKPKQGFYLMKKKCEQDIIQNATGRT